MKNQIFEYQWGIPQDGCHYISEGDLYHAICNSDRFPFSLMKKPETPEEKVMQVERRKCKMGKDYRVA